MIRKHLISGQSGAEPGFHWRGAEVTRLEGFTDAVFAFAVTLLVVSLEVPKTLPELLMAMRGFLAFGVCFALLANVWYQHYRFFRRYALETPWVAFLNCVFAVLRPVLCLPAQVSLHGDIQWRRNLPPEMRTLFTIWSLGYAAVFAVFSLLYLHAWRIRAQLTLTPRETLRTQVSLVDHLAMVIVALLSTALARTMPERFIGFAGYIYFIVPLYFTLAHSIASRKRTTASMSGLPVSIPAALLYAPDSAAVTANGMSTMIRLLARDLPAFIEFASALLLAAAPVVVMAAAPPEPSQARRIDSAADYVVLPPRERVEPENRILTERLEHLLPALMSEVGLTRGSLST